MSAMPLIKDRHSAPASRPADLAARYAGEEFVLLLPNTDPAGCEQVGLRTREAIRGLEIPHLIKLGAKVVTASLGGATAWPANVPALDGISLVGAADKALYAAKSEGRDRLVMSEQVAIWPHAKRA